MLSVIIATIWIIGIAALVAATMAYVFLSWGFVLTKLWAWLLVLPFGLTAITFSQAVAIAAILGTIKIFVNPNYDEAFKITDETKEGEYPKWAKPALIFSMPWITLIFVWLVKITFIA